MLVSAIAEWREGIPNCRSETFEKMLRSVQDSIVSLKVPKAYEEKLQTLQHNVFTLKGKAYKINFSHLKLQKGEITCQPTTTDSIAMETPMDIIKLLCLYPIAVSICRNLTTKDLLCLAAAVPSVMWANTQKMAPQPEPRLLRMSADPGMANLVNAKTTHASPRYPLGEPSPARVGRTNFSHMHIEQVFMVVIPGLRAYFESIEKRRVKSEDLLYYAKDSATYKAIVSDTMEGISLINEFKVELRDLQGHMKMKIPQTFGLQPAKMGTFGHCFPQASSTRRRSSSLPPKLGGKPDDSIWIPPKIETKKSEEIGPVTDHGARVFESTRRILVDQLSLKRLLALKATLGYTASEDVVVYRLENLDKRYLSGLNAPLCKCDDPFVRGCLRPGLRLGSGADQQLDLWTRFWFEEPRISVEAPSQPFIVLSETELLDIIDRYDSGWTSKDHQRIEEVVAALMRVGSARWTICDQGFSPYWKVLQQHTSECAYCGSTKPALDAHFEEMWVRVMKNYRRSLLHPTIGVYNRISSMLERRLGTFQCWGCEKFFCTVGFGHPYIALQVLM
jgi:hypothetical protein